MANVRTRGTDKVKVVSAVITLAVIVALVFGIFSVAQNVKKSKNNNLVNLNETEGNVAIKTDDDPDIPVEEPTVGDDDIINANARASMSDDGDGTAGLADKENRIFYIGIAIVLAGIVIGLGAFLKKHYVQEEKNEE